MTRLEVRLPSLSLPIGAKAILSRPPCLQSSISLPEVGSRLTPMMGVNETDSEVVCVEANPVGFDDGVNSTGAWYEGVRKDENAKVEEGSCGGGVGVRMGIGRSSVEIGRSITSVPPFNTTMIDISPGTHAGEECRRWL